MPLKNIVRQFAPKRDNGVQELQFSLQASWGNLLKTGWLPFGNRGGHGNGFLQHSDPELVSVSQKDYTWVAPLSLIGPLIA
jgi:hypothetical protein